jgi:phosphatidylglycerol:prolipoprotein diacylglycerol transferase
VFTAYVHDLDPVLISFSETLKVRWYGLAYLAGFVLGWWVLKKLAEKKLFVLEPEKVSDFIAYAAFLGVFLGGRLGYVLFYMLPSPDGRQQIADDPLTIIKVWDGGMASHGGMLGLVIFAWFYSRRHKVSWTGLGDGLCVVAPLGIFFGRLANFINGELYGTRAEGLPWLVKFPGALFNSRCQEFENQRAALNVASQAATGPSAEILRGPASRSPFSEQALNAAIRADEKVKTAVEPFLYQRHPSQLYEALAEGLILFVILLTMRLRFRKLPTGVLTGTFFLLYGVGRIFVERFRVPDSELVFDILTKGQFYSIFLILGGFAFLFFAFRNGKHPTAS